MQKALVFDEATAQAGKRQPSNWGHFTLRQK